MRPVTTEKGWLRALSGLCRSQPHRVFSTSMRLRTTNQVYSCVRRPDALYTYQLLSSSSRTPLVTFWTTSWCATCHVVAPLLKSIIESGVGEAEGGVGYCEVQYDSPDIMSGGLGMEYMITSIPTLLSFDAGEAQVRTKITDGKRLADRSFLEDWVRIEAQRHGGRGGGNGGTSSLGALFGLWR
ncbi:uncharacterized protein GGS22DRAFT_124156 [Annulohypoxylon maeteangense]|uniref:uncharacterized protein n=1 Tax=Annulohypoxylon maeteangense TaxID=1927788 RepID=UPI002008B819|nr:uncharacterized protein GGS22DRAFT_124156 [Annulohypoxylon maeteangense]KAI0886101.1 hypothetical protein GGS22DRAFT_124156 [Annulohypoxylon maeteangense]